MKDQGCHEPSVTKQKKESAKLGLSQNICHETKKKKVQNQGYHETSVTKRKRRKRKSRDFTKHSSLAKKDSARLGFWIFTKRKDKSKSATQHKACRSASLAYCSLAN